MKIKLIILFSIISLGLKAQFQIGLDNRLSIGYVYTGVIAKYQHNIINGGVYYNQSLTDHKFGGMLGVYFYENISVKIGTNIRYDTGFYLPSLNMVYKWDKLLLDVNLRPSSNLLDLELGLLYRL